MRRDVADTIGRWAAEGRADVIATLEALADPRMATGRAITVDELQTELRAVFPETDTPALVRDLDEAALVMESSGALALRTEVIGSTTAAIQALAAHRELEWADLRLPRGELMRAFATHVQEELDDLELVDAEPSERDGAPVRLRLRWRREESRIELRHCPLFVDRLVDIPSLLISSPSALDDEAVHRFAADPETRFAVALYDLERLEKMSAVRSTAFVYFEWFLRDTYGVKLVASETFTRALVDLGVISLGFG